MTSSLITGQNWGGGEGNSLMEQVTAREWDVSDNTASRDRERERASVSVREIETGECRSDVRIQKVRIHDCGKFFAINYLFATGAFLLFSFKELHVFTCSYMHVSKYLAVMPF